MYGEARGDSPTRMHYAVAGRARRLRQAAAVACLLHVHTCSGGSYWFFTLALCKGCFGTLLGKVNAYGLPYNAHVILPSSMTRKRSSSCTIRWVHFCTDAHFFRNWRWAGRFKMPHFLLIATMALFLPISNFPRPRITFFFCQCLYFWDILGANTLRIVRRKGSNVHSGIRRNIRPFSLILTPCTEITVHYVMLYYFLDQFALESVWILLVLRLTPGGR